MVEANRRTTYREIDLNQKLLLGFDYAASLLVIFGLAKIR